MLNLIKKFVKEDDGVTMVEYGLMAALVALAAVAGATLLGGNLSGMFTNIANQLPQ